MKPWDDRPRATTTGPLLTYFARHGETESNRSCRYAGHGQEPLTKLGVKQILDLAKSLVGQGIERIWVSPVARAVESATLISRELGIPLQSDARLAEMSMGPWEGLTEAEVERTYPREYLIWNTTPARLDVKGRETLSLLASRVMDVVGEACRQTRPVLLMTHVAPIRVAALTVLGLDLNHYKRLHIPNAACLILDHQRADLHRWPSGDSIRAEMEQEPIVSDRTEARPC